MTAAHDAEAPRPSPRRRKFRRDGLARLLRAATARIRARAPIARGLAMSTAVVVVPIQALPATAQSWRPLQGQTLTSAGQHPELQRGWSDIILANEEYARKELQRPVAPGKIFPLPVLWLPIEIGASRYIVAIASTRSCLAGANNAGSGSEPSACEVRVLDPSGKSVATGRACFFDTTDEDQPAANKHDRTEVDVAAAAREVRLRSIVANKTWPQCSTTLKVP